MIRAYCGYCKKNTGGQIIFKKETFKVKGEDISINSSVVKCEECHREIFVEKIDEKNLEMVYAEYRRRHDLLFPSEIKKIREKYTLSQRSLARILGWGEITIHRYESGGLQDNVHNDLLKLISNPENMLDIYEKNAYLLPSHLKDTLHEKINELINEGITPKFNESLEQYLLKDKGFDDFTGYKKFDLEKIKNMILYILKFEETFQTKINKLLWYMDFFHYKKCSLSISGNSYLHFPYGPVPDHYDLIMAVMLEEKLIDKDEILHHETICEQLKPLIAFDESIFTKNELTTMDIILEKFKNFNSTALSEYSHNEAPYKETKLSEPISYTLAEKLSL